MQSLRRDALAPGRFQAQRNFEGKSIYGSAAGAKRCFVVNFNPFSLSRQSLLDFLDTQPDVVNWLTSNALPGQVMVVSERPCIEVARLIRARFSGELFTVSTVSEIDGWMNQGYWDFVNVPKSSGRWDGLTPFTQLLLGYRPPGN